MSGGSDGGGWYACGTRPRGWWHVGRCRGISRVRDGTLMTPGHTAVQVRSSECGHICSHTKTNRLVVAHRWIPIGCLSPLPATYGSLLCDYGAYHQESGRCAHFFPVRNGAVVMVSCGPSQYCTQLEKLINALNPVLSPMNVLNPVLSPINVSTLVLSSIDVLNLVLSQMNFFNPALSLINVLSQVLSSTNVLNPIFPLINVLI